MTQNPGKQHTGSGLHRFMLAFKPKNGCMCQTGNKVNALVYIFWCHVAYLSFSPLKRTLNIYFHSFSMYKEGHYNLSKHVNRKFSQGSHGMG